MRIVETLPRTFFTNFHGVMLPVLPDENFLIAEADGTVWAYTQESEPAVNETMGCWLGATMPRRVAVIDLEGQDWRSTLAEVDPIIQY